MSYLWYWPSGGWDFDQWKEAHPWQPIKSEQSGKKALLPLLRRSETLRDWQQKREGWLQITRQVLGTLNDQPPARVEWEALVTRETPHYIMRRLRYPLTTISHPPSAISFPPNPQPPTPEFGYAWLLIPHHISLPRPAMVALHQTAPQGKAEPVGIQGDRELAYGRELVRRGFVVLAPDAIGFGERQKDHERAFYRSADEFYSAHPDGSVMAKMAYDVQRAVDLLQRLPEVDGSRIGCIGHSHGGYGTLFAMLYDERIRAGIMSCGVTTLRTDPTPHRWWRMTSLIPRLGFYENQIEKTPIDFHHWLALIAPRPLMVVGALNDAIFPNTNHLRQVLRMVRRVYRLYGASDALRGWIFNGGHCFPRAARTRAYRMLREWLESDG